MKVDIIFRQSANSSSAKIWAPWRVEMIMRYVSHTESSKNLHEFLLVLTEEVNINRIKQTHKLMNVLIKILKPYYLN